MIFPAGSLGPWLEFPFMSDSMMTFLGTPNLPKKVAFINPFSTLRKSWG